MKKYIILTALILLSVSAQAREKKSRETLVPAQKQESTFSQEKNQKYANVQLEHMKKRYSKKYAELSKEELKKHKTRLEQTIESSKKNNKRRFQEELDFVNSLLNEEK